MNDHAVQKNLKGREVTEEWIEMAWPIFNGYTIKKQGVSKEDLMWTLYDV